LTLQTVIGAVGVKDGPNLTYVAANLIIGSGVGDNTSSLSLEIPFSSMGGTLAVAGTGGILLTSNIGIPAHLTGGTSALQAGTYTTKKYLKLTEPVMKSLATLVCIGKHNAHKIVHAQLMQHGNDAYHQKGGVSQIYSSTPMHQQDHYKRMISGQYTPLARNVANMSATCCPDTRCCSNFGQMGPCCKHKIHNVGT
jgi:hypothetical protein